MPLYEIRVHYEADRLEDAEALAEAFERVICPHPADQDHRCPHRWNLITAELDPNE